MPEHLVTLTTTDGCEVSFPCRDGLDVVTAAERAEVFLNAQCHSGACGACIATAVEGDFVLGTVSDDALPPDRRAVGDVLMCRTRPAGPLKLALPYAHAMMRFARPPQRRARISAKRFLTPDTVRLDLQLAMEDDGTLALPFDPGQFVQLAVPATEVKRPYSLANAPNWDGTLEFLIKLRDGGAFSTWLRETAEVGADVEVEGPFGTFTLVDHGLRPRLFVAGGCGLASVLSMVRQMAAFDEPHPCHLLFGVWRRDELFYQDELAALAAAYAPLTVTTCVTTPTAGWTGVTGSVVDALDRTLTQQSASPDIYICGSPSLVEGVKRVAARYGVPPDQVIHERYLAYATR